MDDSVEEPSGKNLLVEIIMLLPCFVDGWIFEGVLFVEVLLENEDKEARPGSPKGVVKERKPVSEENLSTVATVYSKIDLSEDKEDVLVEVVTDVL